MGGTCRISGRMRNDRTPALPKCFENIIYIYIYIYMGVCVCIYIYGCVCIYRMSQEERTQLRESVP